MQESASGKMFIKLCGNWSITGVSEQLRFLKDQLQSMSSPNAADAPNPGESDPEIDVHDVEQIDLSGYQLLAIWLRHVKMLGFSPVLVNVPETFRQDIRYFGFGAEFDRIVGAKECS